MVKLKVKLVKLHKLMKMMVDSFNVNLKCHIQEFIKAYNGIIPLTTFLEASEEG
jgi:hypothetical protein